MLDNLETLKNQNEEINAEEEEQIQLKRRENANRSYKKRMQAI